MLGTLDLTSHLGAVGPIHASGIKGAWTIGGNVLHAIQIDQDIESAISITGYLKSSLTCGGSLHDLSVSGVGTGGLYAPPDITIGSSYAHTMSLHQNVGTIAISGALDPNGTIQITGANSDLCNLSLPAETGVVYGSVSVARNLRSASLAEIAKDATLLVGGQLGYGGSDQFYVGGEVGGSLSAHSVDTQFEVVGAVTGALTVNDSFNTTNHSFPAASIGGVDPNGLVQIGTLAGDLAFSQTISGDVHILGDILVNAALLAGQGSTGSVQVQGDLAGQIYAEGDPNDPNDTNGPTRAMSLLHGAVWNAIFYPGHTNWFETADCVAEKLWPSNL